jgi:hypothetical protein
MRGVPLLGGLRVGRAGRVAAAAPRCLIAELSVSVRERSAQNISALKMLISLEGAYAMHMSIFAVVEHLRQTSGKLRAPTPEQSAYLRSHHPFANAFNYLETVLPYSIH